MTTKSVLLACALLLLAGCGEEARVSTAAERRALVDRRKALVEELQTVAAESPRRAEIEAEVARLAAEIKASNDRQLELDREAAARRISEQGRGKK